MEVETMAIATELLTYEQYMSEGEINKRYDIIDGVRIYMTNPSIGHQKTQGNVYSGIRAWRQVSQVGEVIMAPCDVLIRRSPLRTRQPDVLIVSHERLGGRDLDDPSPLEPAPELVVEILSPSETRPALKGKLADYQKVGVLECWVVNRKLQTVEVVSLTPEGQMTVATYGLGETVLSQVFPSLTMAIAEVFAP
jgi:Uma2 family endonuclease